MPAWYSGFLPRSPGWEGEEQTMCNYTLAVISDTDDDSGGGVFNLGECSEDTSDFRSEIRVR